MSSETLQLRATLDGHNGWVTSLATCPNVPDLLVSGSRDKTVVAWQITAHDADNFASAKRRLTGHSHIVEDVAISQDGFFALSCSWDKTLRLWNMQDGSSTRFVGHTGDVLTCAFSPDNTIVVSGSRDKTLRMWNVTGEELFKMEGNSAHSDWVSTARFAPRENSTVIVSSSWDKLVKVWDLDTAHLISDYVGHTAPVTSLVLSPDGTMTASGSKDGTVNMWRSSEDSFFSALPSAGSEVYDLAFSPSRFWLAAATAAGIKIYSLHDLKVLEDLSFEVTEGKSPGVLSLAWSSDGQLLYAGYTDGKIRVWQVMSALQA